LTAFALGELDEAEESRIARAVTESPEAQRLVDEMRELSAALKNEFASELKSEKAPANVIDFRDDPWFWSIGRPLALAAVVALLALVSSVAVFSFRRESVRFAQAEAIRLPSVQPRLPDVEGEIQAPMEVPPRPATTPSSKLPLVAGAPAKGFMIGRAAKSSSVGYALNKTLTQPVSREEALSCIREPSGDFSTSTYDYIGAMLFLAALDNTLTVFSDT